MHIVVMVMMKSANLFIESGSRDPRYVITIAVAKDMTFEAPALEEFLITRFKTTDNKIGSTYFN